MPKGQNKYREITPFNPLDKKHLGESVAEFMLSSKAEPLPPEPFLGAGIYAIYYTGEFPLYAKIAKRNRRSKFKCPIYVGKAVPKGARKGLEVEVGSDLYKRLCEHSKSIEYAENLSLSDFRCRYLVVDDIWIPLAESLLIGMFKPLWNVTVDGFGNHDPGKGRHKGQRPAWDVLHPGRPWAEKLQDYRLDLSEIESKVSEITAGYTDLPSDSDTHGNG